MKILILLLVSRAVALVEPNASPAPAITFVTLKEKQIKEVTRISQLPIAEQIKEISKQYDLELLNSQRPPPKQGYFDALGPASRSVEDVTDVEGLYGKAVCAKKDETPKILIARDAPPTTLLHEYIHALQIKNERRWCQLDGRVLDNSEKRERAILYHRFEFEVLKTLWDLKDKMKMNFEDELILIEGLSREHKVFESIGIKALDSKLAEALNNALEDIKANIGIVKWLKQSTDEVRGVLQKMEVIAIKACTEQSDRITDAERINECIKERCRISKISCQEIKEEEIKDFDTDLLAKIVYTWTKPNDVADCDNAKLKKELEEKIEEASPCWTKWTESRSQPNRDVSLKPVDFSELSKKWKISKLSVDKNIQFAISERPEAFIKASYCYMIFQKVTDFAKLPINQFAYAAQSAAISGHLLDEYRAWLDKSKLGQTCTKLVKLFSGETPSRLKADIRGKKYLVIFNPIGSLTGGISQMSEVVKTTLNHERLHVLFAMQPQLKEKMKKKWSELSKDEQEDFKARHASYDFSNELTLLREYFSYSYQSDPSGL